MYHIVEAAVFFKQIHGDYIFDLFVSLPFLLKNRSAFKIQIQLVMLFVDLGTSCCRITGSKRDGQYALSEKYLTCTVSPRRTGKLLDIPLLQTEGEP